MNRVKYGLAGLTAATLTSMALGLHWSYGELQTRYADGQQAGSYATCETMGGEWIDDGCVAPTPEPEPEPEPTPEPELEYWEGFLVGEVIVCPKGWDAAPDVMPDGRTWAACM